MIKKYRIIILALIAALLFISGAFTGYTYCKRANYKGIIKQQEKDAKKVLEHEEKKDKVEKYVKPKIIERIKIVKDTSGCLDVINSDEYIDSLLKSDREAQSSFN
jgi:hypothetical protein